MSATIDERKAVLNETQRTWIKKISEALQLRMADEIVLSGPADLGLARPVGDTLPGFADAPPKPGSPQPAPLSQSKTGPQAQSPTPAPGQPAKPSQPIVFTRTAKIDTTGQEKRRDKLAISGAKSEADVAKLAESRREVIQVINGKKTKVNWQGHSAAKLEEMSRVLREAANPMTGNTNVPEFVPSAKETKEIREKYAQINNAIASGKFDDAARLNKELGLPIPDEKIQLENSRGPLDQTHFSDQQWKTLLALGMANYKASKTNAKPPFNYDKNPTTLQIPNQELSALQGTASYAKLLDDMAGHGVTPLSAPPTQEQIENYIEQVRIKADKQAQIDFPGKPDEQKRALSDALLNASQWLMDGMQVHYKGASVNDMDYGSTAMWTVFLFRNKKLVTDADGKPLTLELPSGPDPQKDRKNYEAWEKKNLKTIDNWRNPNGGGYYYISPTKTPQGFADNTDRDVFGNRHESDCEGMASFRLRTLPPGFKTLGVVSGRLKKGGIGHMVAVFQSPDGRVFLSSNGKQPIPVTASVVKVSGDDIRRAVVAEFDAIYGTPNDGFSLGLGTPTSSTGKPMDVKNQSTDRVLQDASNDDNLRGVQGKPEQMPPLNWDRLAP